MFEQGPGQNFKFIFIFIFDLLNMVHKPIFSNNIRRFVLPAGHVRTPSKKLAKHHIAPSPVITYRTAFLERVEKMSSIMTFPSTISPAAAEECATIAIAGLARRAVTPKKAAACFLIALSCGADYDDVLVLLRDHCMDWTSHEMTQFEEELPLIV